MSERDYILAGNYQMLDALYAHNVEMLAFLKAFVNHARLCNGDVGRRAIAALASDAEKIINKTR